MHAQGPWNVPWYNPGPLFPQIAGSTAHPTYPSPLHGPSIGYRIYLPPSYASQPQRLFPLIMVLPGYGSTEIWSVSDAWLIQAMVDGLIPEAVIVHMNPLGNCFWHDGATSTDAAVPVQAYSTVVNEMLPHLLATYRIGDRMEERAMIGFSMGGYGAFNLALRSGEFRNVISVDGSLRVPGNESAAFQFSCGNDPQVINGHNIFTVLAGQSTNAMALKHMILVASVNHADHNAFHQQLVTAGASGSYEYLPSLSHEFDQFVSARGQQMLAFLNAHLQVPALRLPLKVLLKAAYQPDSTLMKAQLSMQGMVPLVEPFTAAGYVFENGTVNPPTSGDVLERTGADGVVDWVLVELRDTSSQATVVSARAGLLLRDGRVVDADGTNTLRFSASPGLYRVTLRHRTHLRATSAAPHPVWQITDTLDLSLGNTLFSGDSLAVGWCGDRRCLLAGDVNGDGSIRYSGANNDRDLILMRIGGEVPTSTVAGYFPEDLNLDGLVRYSGQQNDRDVILVGIGGQVPTLTISANP